MTTYIALIESAEYPLVTLDSGTAGHPWVGPASLTDSVGAARGAGSVSVG